MKVFDSKLKKIGYFFYRIIQSIIDPIKFFKGFYGYVWFFKDLINYKLKNRKARLLGTNLFPILDERTPLTSFDAHYFYQQLWAFENVLRHKPIYHVDVASTYQMSGYLSKIVRTKFIDLRPIKTSLENLEILKGDILHLPLKDNSVPSLSCLHVIEHIGLGRYGDPIDPDGMVKACVELRRILAPGGFLYVSTPIGKERLCFNAHRISSPDTVTEYFKDLNLISFSVVNDDGQFIQDAHFSDYKDSNYACGMFLFNKK